ncbi:LPXTG cell wall anchor domain-containing protein [Enterorhabdus sp. P55]|nr:LPXTG cell wall anchor domain-containing protein [Enterorhabdus sp. P55]
MTKGPAAVLTRLAQTGDGALALTFAGLAGAASLAAAAAALSRRRSARR